jgi:hypothetical protein
VYEMATTRPHRSPSTHARGTIANERICPFDRQPRANFETNCRSPRIGKLSLVKAVEQRLNAIQEVTTRGETCAVSPWTKHRTHVTRIASRSRPDHSVIIAVITVHSTQVVLVDCCPDSPAQTRSCILVGSKMNPAVNASVGDVIGNLPE